MGKYIGTLLILFSLFKIGYAQKSTDSIQKVDLSKIALINQTDSYVTLPMDIGNIAPLIFEANISPSFIIRQRKDSRLMAVLTSQIVIRMYDKESLPVRTPSYKPQISFCYLPGDKSAKKHTTFFGRIGHHSNGQDGSFYDDKGQINLESGNFSTNFFETGMIRTSHDTSLSAFKFLKSSLEIHPKNMMLDELHGQYSGLRWHNTLTAHKVPFINSDKRSKPKFSLKVETTIMLDNYNNLNTFDLNRLNASLTLYYHPSFLEDIGFFVQFYHGNDYYNIYFQERLDIIRFGIMTKVLRF